PYLAREARRTVWALMVMPRSRSLSTESSTCSLPAISRSVRPPVIWIRRYASVDLPWSIWATMEKLRMLEMGTVVMGAGYHSHPRAATILLYFQGLSSRQADSTKAQNALRNAPCRPLLSPPPERGPRPA